MSLPFPASAIRELPFLDLRSLAFSDEDFLALTAAFPHTGVNTTWRVSVTGKDVGVWTKKEMFRDEILEIFVLFNYPFSQIVISNDFL